MGKSRIACLSLVKGSSAALRELAESFSPRVETGDTLAYFDIAFSDDPYTVGQGILERARARRLELRVGIAANKNIATIAARHGAGAVTIVSDGKEQEFLSPLPLAVLEPLPELAEILQRWGIHSVGALARLPAKKIIAHLGKDGWWLHEKARGLDPQPLSPTPRVPVFVESVDLDWPMTELDPFLQSTQPPLERLIGQLSMNGLACQSLEIGLQLDTQGEEKRSIRVRTPTRDLKTLLRLLQCQLAAKPPAGAVTGFCLMLQPNAPQKAQLSLFGPPALSPLQLSTALAQLCVLAGLDRACSPQTVDGQRPERFTVAEYAPPPAPLFPEPVRDLTPLIAVRVLRPPVRLDVTLGEAWPWPPSRLRSLENAREISGSVRTAAGPWRMEERWWSSKDACSRDYWDVELASGGLYRIFQDRQQKRWFSDGMYD